MAKHSTGLKPEFKVREALPRVRDEKGGVLLECPFCEIPHTVGVGQDSACGTTLRVTAVQTIVPTRTVHKRGLKCFKCGKGGGEMVPFNQGFIHLIDCVPVTKLMAQPPKEFSRWAGMVYQFPEFLRKRVERVTGAVKRVDEIDPQGRETGKTLGYIFYRGA